MHVVGRILLVLAGLFLGVVALALLGSGSVPGALLAGFAAAGALAAGLDPRPGGGALRLVAFFAGVALLGAAGLAWYAARGGIGLLAAAPLALAGAGVLWLASRGARPLVRAAPTMPAAPVPAEVDLADVPLPLTACARCGHVGLRAVGMRAWSGGAELRCERCGFTGIPLSFDTREDYRLFLEGLARGADEA